MLDLKTRVELEEEGVICMTVNICKRDSRSKIVHICIAKTQTFDCSGADVADELRVANCGSLQLLKVFAFAMVTGASPMIFW